MKRKNVARVMSTALALSFALAGAACGGPEINGGGGTSHATEIVVQNTAGGVGRLWLDNAFARFADLKKNEEYEPGKKGVRIDVTQSFDRLDNLATDGYNLYFTQAGNNLQMLAQQGCLEDISDVLTDVGMDGKTIQSKIDQDYIKSCMYGDSYYALPHYEMFPGLSYDIEMFERDSLYISATSEDAEPYEAFGKTVYFTTGVEGAAKKSCGNDGLFNTSDDGLPTSLLEFLVLCDKISQNATPFIVAGNHNDYINYYSAGQIAALSGYEAMQSNFSFEGDIECVDGYTNEPLFAGLEDRGIDIKKPQTKSITVNKETGYLTRKQTARYYTVAMLEIFEKMGWFHSKSTSPNYDHSTVQEMFIQGINGTKKDQKIAMIFEASHWVNELNDNGILERFYNDTGRNPKTSERRIGFMWLPTQVYDSVQPVAEGEAGNKYTLIDTMLSYAIMNSNIKSEGVKRACKEFLKFLYTDTELQHFTYTTGVSRSGISTMLEENEEYNKMQFFQKNVIAVTKSNALQIARQYADNEIYLQGNSAFYFGISAGVHAVRYNEVKYSSAWEAFKNKALAGVANTKTAFEQGLITQEDWTSKYSKYF